MNGYQKHYYNDLLVEHDFRNSLKKGSRCLGQLRSCKANVYRTLDNEFTYLKSYNTIVALIDNLQDDEGWDLLRTEYTYTATSDQHIAKFFKDYGSMFTKVFRTDIDNKGKYYKRVK